MVLLQFNDFLIIFDGSKKKAHPPNKASGLFKKINFSRSYEHHMILPLFLSEKLQLMHIHICIQQVLFIKSVAIFGE